MEKSLLSIALRCYLNFIFLIESLPEAKFVQLRVILSDLLNEILVELNEGWITRVPMSNRIGGAEKVVNLLCLLLL